jgi:hypothetical protein
MGYVLLTIVSLKDASLVLHLHDLVMPHPNHGLDRALQSVSVLMSSAQNTIYTGAQQAGRLDMHIMCYGEHHRKAMYQHMASSHNCL